MITMPVLITPSYANKLAHDRVVAIRSSHASTRSLVHRRPAGCVAFQRTHRFLSPVSFPAETSRRNRLTVFSSPLITTLLTTRPRHLVWTTLNEPHVCFHLPFFFSFFFYKVASLSSSVHTVNYRAGIHLLVRNLYST